MFWQNKILFRNGKVAFAENCCCQPTGCFLYANKTPTRIRVQLSGTQNGIPSPCPGLPSFDGLYEIPLEAFYTPTDVCLPHGEEDSIRWVVAVAGSVDIPVNAGCMEGWLEVHVGIARVCGGPCGTDWEWVRYAWAGAWFFVVASSCPCFPIYTIALNEVTDMVFAPWGDPPALPWADPVFDPAPDDCWKKGQAQLVSWPT